MTTKRSSFTGRVLAAAGVCCATLATAAICNAAVEPKHGTFTASDGVKIHYLEAGQGTPVILIHGYTGSAEGNWFANGVAEALVGKHRVVAIDCRGHGQSDKPHDPAKYGPRMAKDVIELMDHLKIAKAHVHGYSMGGMITGQLLATHPERFITACFGGSGVPEVDPKQQAKVPADTPGPDPQEAEAAGKLRGAPNRDNEALAAVRQYPWKEGERPKIDLTKIKIPVLAINGEFDRPNAKTHRMQRELANFKSVVLPGKSHLTAIMAGYIPKEYIDALVKFIDENDK
jgi:pimeloyl-ACP methyl ester carboxylesterase